jgi:hypothetical protein
MMEGEDTGWLSELEKKGLHQEAGILEYYGIDSETDVSLFDQGDLRNLVSQGLNPMQLKKLERWCDTVRPRAEKTLPSSLNTPTAAALLSSETLNVLTLTMTQTMTWRSCLNSQVLRTVQSMHQEGPKRRPKRSRSL